jgi:hypothetical protein
MQAKAIFKAANNVKGANPWIEIPLAGNVKEYTIIKKVITKVAKKHA